MAVQRRFALIDRLLAEVGHALATLAAPVQPVQPSPAAGRPEAELDAPARRHVAGLMRIDHAGEVAAQALYRGQAVLARDPAQRAWLLEAAAEERDHLAWCADRLRELGAEPSRLAPFWYAGAWWIGFAAAASGDAWSLGFVSETERQVEAHLDDHLARLPEQDARSRAILERMRADEARHGAGARARGGRPLPAPVRWAMARAADVLRWTAYRL